MTKLSADNGLNAPEFLWSPYFSSYHPHPQPAVIKSIKVRLNSILASEPRLSWLHVHDGVGARSKKHSNGVIIWEYPLTSEKVIRYYNDILVPAASGTALKSNCINMEFFVFDDQKPANMLPGDIHEQEERQSAYMQANIPLGVCFEIGYWYGSKYYRIVPDVIGRDTNLAVNTLHFEGFTTVELFGSNLNTKILKQEPPGGTYVQKATSVKLTAS
jgi:PASTA domain